MSTSHVVTSLLLGLMAIYAFVWLTRPKGAPTIPNPPAPPEPAPEPSCFVKGLIRSMRETPGEWKDDSSFYMTMWTHSSGLWLTRYPMVDGFPRATDELMRLFDHPLPLHEAKALTEAWTTYLDKPSREAKEAARLAALAVEQARLASERVVFEKLGCPDTP